MAFRSAQAANPVAAPRSLLSAVGLVCGFCLLGVCIFQIASESPEEVAVDRRLDDGWKALVRGVIEVAFALAVLAIELAFAWRYQEMVVAKIQRRDVKAPAGARDFRHTLFDCCCCDDFTMCLHVVCCGYTRSAHNAAVLNIMEFWPTWFTFLIIDTFLWLCFVPCCFRVWFRTEVKRKLGLPPDCFCDCCCVIFCGSCELGQQSLDIDELLGVKVMCCCEFTQEGVPQGAPPPVVVASPELCEA